MKNKRKCSSLIIWIRERERDGEEKGRKKISSSSSPSFLAILCLNLRVSEWEGGIRYKITLGLLCALQSKNILMMTPRSYYYYSSFAKQSSSSSSRRARSSSSHSLSICHATITAGILHIPTCYSSTKKNIFKIVNSSCFLIWSRCLLFPLVALGRNV